MRIKSIKVENFRNIRNAELEFGDGVNIFCGNNAQGKTNLLEAIAICLGKSFRNIRRGDIIPFDSTDSKTKISLFYESEMFVGKVNEIRYEHNHNSSLVQINSIPLKKAADLYGEFKYVVFTPDNLSLIKGEPALRRGYLDNVAIMQNKAHRRFSSEYNSALKQRCAAYFHGGSCPEMLSVWDDILIRQGINLTYGRLKYLDLIREYSCRIYEELSGGEQLSLVYNSDVFTDSISFDNREELYKVYKSRLDSVNSEGQSSKTPGAHKDDVVFCICGKNARSYGSQGQLRSIAVSLKLAEAQIIRDFNRENSVVLLDEVLGELDESRRRYVVEHFDTSQVFITSCNMNDFAGLANLKVWSVEDGVCTPRE